MTNILNEVISRLKSENDDCCRIMHKRGWLDFLEGGDMVFTPHELKDVLRDIIGQRPPRGEKLIFLDRHYTFHVMSDKTPDRPEEALERFIVVSNRGKFFNQVPIGGRRESLDIGIEENDSRFVFVEVKSWSSKKSRTNPPLYAVVQSLKNLIQYRIIHQEQIKHHQDCKHYNEVDLIVLAPESYYRDYRLIDNRTGLRREDMIGIVKKALNDLSSEFNTNIAFMVLNISKEDINIQCQSLKPNEHNIVELSEINSIPELARDQWKPLVSSDKK